MRRRKTQRWKKWWLQANIIGVDGKNTAGVCVDSAVAHKVARREGVVFVVGSGFIGVCIGVLAQKRREAPVAVADPDHLCRAVKRHAAHAAAAAAVVAAVALLQPEAAVEALVVLAVAAAVAAVAAAAVAPHRPTAGWAGRHKQAVPRNKHRCGAQEGGEKKERKEADTPKKGGEQEKEVNRVCDEKKPRRRTQRQWLWLHITPHAL